LAPVRHATSSSVLYKLGEGASLGGRPTPVLTSSLRELTGLPTPVVAVISLLASRRPVHSIAENADRTGTSRWARGGRIDKADRFDGDGDAAVTALAKERVCGPILMNGCGITEVKIAEYEAAEAASRVPDSTKGTSVEI